MTDHPRALHTVFHDGERRMYNMLGIGERQHEPSLRMIRDHMPDQHREFFKMLPSVHIGVINANGYPFAVPRTGLPEFLNSPDAKTLTIVSEPLPGEPDTLIFAPGAKISVLRFEMETRCRNRMNASIRDKAHGTLTLHVDQSYGNFPKYIQTLSRSTDGQRQTQAPKISGHLTNIDQALIGQADMRMLATSAPELTSDPRAGVDINHRGGNPGFAKVLDAQMIEFPTYKGNSFYNSFGDILLDHRVGLRFWDLATGTFLNLKGIAERIGYGPAELPFMGRGLRITSKAQRAPKTRHTFATPFRNTQPKTQMSDRKGQSK